MFGVTGEYIGDIPALIRDVQGSNDDGDQVIDHGLLEFVAVFTIVVFFAFV